MAFMGITRPVTRSGSRWLTTSGPDMSLLLDGDSWMAWNAGMLAYLTGLNDKGSTANYKSGKQLVSGTAGVAYRLDEFLDLPVDDPDPQDPFNTRLAAYNGIVFDGSGNDFINGPTTIDIADLKVALIAALDRCLDETHNVLYISTAPMSGQPPGAGWGAAWVTGNAFDGRDLNAMRDEYDDWAEAYCAAIGVKFIHANNEMAGGTGVLYERFQLSYDPGHPNAAGSEFLGSLISPLIATGAIPRTSAMTAVLERPNRELLTATDMANIKALVDGLGSEWSKIPANGDYWLFKQSDVTALGNALTGLKNGLVVDVNEVVSQFVLSASTVTSTANGISFGPNIIGLLSVSPDDVGRTASYGVINESSTSTADDTLKRYLVNSSGNGFTNATGIKHQGIAGTNVTLVSSGGGEHSVALDIDPAYLGSCIEMQSVENASNNDISLYASGSIVAGTPVAKAFGPANTYAIAINGQNFGANGYVATAHTYEYSVLYITDGTNDAALWASVSESI